MIVDNLVSKTSHRIDVLKLCVGQGTPQLKKIRNQTDCEIPPGNKIAAFAVNPLSTIGEISVQVVNMTLPKFAQRGFGDKP